MAERCITIDGALVRVTAAFDATEGSDDMKAMRALLAAARNAPIDWKECTGCGLSKQQCRRAIRGGAIKCCPDCDHPASPNTREGEQS